MGADSAEIGSPVILPSISPRACCHPCGTPGDSIAVPVREELSGNAEKMVWESGNKADLYACPSAPVVQLGDGTTAVRGLLAVMARAFAAP